MPRMSMGTRETDQSPLWIAASDLPASPGHPFYARLERGLGRPRLRPVRGRPMWPVLRRGNGAPESAARPVFPAVAGVGYFEGIDAERGIAWRAADSLAVRSFVRLALQEAGPDHSTISRTRRLIDVETHRAVFTWVQQRLVEVGLLKGKTIAIDATTLEANAAMRSIVRRGTGETDQGVLTRVAKTAGLRTPAREDLRRLARDSKEKTADKRRANP